MSETKTIIQIRRGPEAGLPAETAEGEPLFCLDSHRLFVGMGPGDAPVPVDADAASIGGVPVDQTPPTDGQILIFDQSTGEYVPADPIVSGPDAPGAAPTKPPVQIGIVDDTGMVRRASGSADGAINVNVNGGTSGAPIPVTVSGTVDVASASGIDVSGSTVSIDNFPASQRVNATSWPLPTGAATEASLGTDGATPPTITGTGIRGWLRAVYEKLVAGLTISGSVSVSNFPATQPVSAVSLPLPAGAATSALQTTGNTSVASIDTKTPTAGQKTMANSSPVVIASDQAAIPVTANVGTTNGLALDATLTGGTQKTKVVDSAGTNALAVDASGAAAQNLTKVGGTAVDTNSGNKSAGTQRVVIATDQPSIPMSSSGETGTIYNGSVALTPKFKVITASASGATTIVAAVTSKKLRVLRWDLVANGLVNVKWQSHVTPTDLTGLYYLSQNGGVVAGYCPIGIFETVAGEALDINLSLAVAVGGVLTYVEV